MIFPDISFYQDDNETPQSVDFVKMKTQTDWVICRAGQNTWIDPDFATFWNDAKEAGLKRGSYWFYDSRSEPESQARLWRDALDGDLGELPLHVDLEENYGGAWEGWRKWMAFIEYVQRYIPDKKIVIYTGFYYWGSYGPDPDRYPEANAFFGQFPLWIPRYKATEPLIPDWTWDEDLIWQFTMTGDGPAYGVESLGIDLNEFRGSEEDLEWYVDEDVYYPYPPDQEFPDEEPDSDFVTGKLLYGMNLRTSATVNNTNQIGYLFLHTEVAGWRVTEGENRWIEIDSSLGNLYVAEYHNGIRYIETDTTPAPEPTPYTDEIVIPEAEEGWGFYQLLHDNPPRQDNFTESKDRHLPMPETVKVMAKELWETVPQAWVDFQLDLVRLDSPGRTEEQHLATRHSMVEDNRAFTDLDNYIDDEHYNWKVSLSTGGNIVYGWRNGRNLHIKCLDMSKAPPKAEDVYNKPWLIWRATQIHPRVEYLFDGDVQVGERRNKLPDGTYRVTHFPQGKNCTTFPNMINGGEKVIPDWHIARKLEAGDVVKVVNLASDQT